MHISRNRKEVFPLICRQVSENEIQFTRQREKLALDLSNNTTSFQDAPRSLLTLKSSKSAPLDPNNCNDKRNEKELHLNLNDPVRNPQGGRNSQQIFNERPHTFHTKGSNNVKTVNAQRREGGLIESGLTSDILIRIHLSEFEAVSTVPSSPYINSSFSVNKGFFNASRNISKTSSLSNLGMYISSSQSNSIPTVRASSKFQENNPDTQTQPTFTVSASQLKEILFQELMEGGQFEDRFNAYLHSTQYNRGGFYQNLDQNGSVENFELSSLESVKSESLSLENVLFLDENGNELTSSLILKKYDVIQYAFIRNSYTNQKAQLSTILSIFRSEMYEEAIELIMEIDWEIDFFKECAPSDIEDLVLNSEVNSSPPIEHYIMNNATLRTIFEWIADILLNSYYKQGRVNNIMSILNGDAITLNNHGDSLNIHLILLLSKERKLFYEAIVCVHYFKWNDAFSKLEEINSISQDDFLIPSKAISTKDSFIFVTADEDFAAFTQIWKADSILLLARLHLEVESYEIAKEFINIALGQYTRYSHYNGIAECRSLLLLYFGNCCKATIGISPPDESFHHFSTWLTGYPISDTLTSISYDDTPHLMKPSTFLQNDDNVQRIEHQTREMRRLLQMNVIGKREESIYWYYRSFVEESLSKRRELIKKSISLQQETGYQGLIGESMLQFAFSFQESENGQLQCDSILKQLLQYADIPVYTRILALLSLGSSTRDLSLLNQAKSLLLFSLKQAKLPIFNPVFTKIHTLIQETLIQYQSCIFIEDPKKSLILHDIRCFINHHPQYNDIRKSGKCKYLHDDYFYQFEDIFNDISKCIDHSILIIGQNQDDICIWLLMKKKQNNEVVFFRRDGAAKRIDPHIISIKRKMRQLYQVNTNNIDDGIIQLANAQDELESLYSLIFDDRLISLLTEEQKYQLNRKFPIDLSVIIPERWIDLPFEFLYNGKTKQYLIQMFSITFVPTLHFIVERYRRNFPSSIANPLHPPNMNIPNQKANDSVPIRDKDSDLNTISHPTLHPAAATSNYMKIIQPQSKSSTKGKPIHSKTEVKSQLIISTSNSMAIPRKEIFEESTTCTSHTKDERRTPTLIDRVSEPLVKCQDFILISGALSQHHKNIVNNFENCKTISFLSQSVKKLQYFLLKKVAPVLYISTNCSITLKPDNRIQIYRPACKHYDAISFNIEPSIQMQLQHKLLILPLENSVPPLKTSTVQHSEESSENVNVYTTSISNSNHNLDKHCASTSQFIQVTQDIPSTQAAHSFYHLLERSQYVLGTTSNFSPISAYFRQEIVECFLKNYFASNNEVKLTPSMALHLSIQELLSRRTTIQFAPVLLMGLRVYGC